MWLYFQTKHLFIDYLFWTMFFIKLDIYLYWVTDRFQRSRPLHKCIPSLYSNRRYLDTEIRIISSIMGFKVSRIYDLRTSLPSSVQGIGQASTVNNPVINRTQQINKVNAKICPIFNYYSLFTVERSVAKLMITIGYTTLLIPLRFKIIIE